MPWTFFDQWRMHILDHLVHTMNAKYKAGHLHRCLSSVDGSCPRPTSSVCLISYRCLQGVGHLILWLSGVGIVNIPKYPWTEIMEDDEVAYMMCNGRARV